MDIKLKNKINKIFNDLFEICLWFIFFMSGVLSFAFAYVVPKAGICAVFFAIMMVYAQRIIDKIKHKEES